METTLLKRISNNVGFNMLAHKDKLYDLFPNAHSQTNSCANFQDFTTTMVHTKASLWSELLQNEVINVNTPNFNPQPVTAIFAL